MREVFAARYAVRAAVQGRLDLSEEAVCEGTRNEFRRSPSVQIPVDRSQLAGGVKRSFLAWIDPCLPAGKMSRPPVSREALRGVAHSHKVRCKHAWIDTSWSPA